MEGGPIKLKNIPLRADAPPRDPKRRSLQRFLRYIRPYMGLTTAAVLFGCVKFILPSTTAISIRYLTDRLGNATANHATKTDFVANLLDRYTLWLTSHLPASWQGDPNSFWAPFN